MSNVDDVLIDFGNVSQEKVKINLDQTISVKRWSLFLFNFPFKAIDPPIFDFIKNKESKDFEDMFGGSINENNDIWSNFKASNDAGKDNFENLFYSNDNNLQVLIYLFKSETLNLKEI